MSYLVRELTDMVWILGERQKKALLASRIYRHRYLGRRLPERDTSQNLVEKFDRVESVNYEKFPRISTVLTKETQFLVKTSIIENENVNTRELNNNLGILRMSVKRIIGKNKNAYHVQLNQEILPRDFVNRVAYCRWLVNRIYTERNGYANRHYYSERNKHLYKITSHFDGR